MSFCSQYGRELWTDNTNAGRLSIFWYSNFYYGLCGYLEKKGLDDDEDEEEEDWDLEKYRKQKEEEDEAVEVERIRQLQLQDGVGE